MWFIDWSCVHCMCYHDNIGLPSPSSPPPLLLSSFQLLIGYEHNYLELWDALAWKPLSIFGPMKVTFPPLPSLPPFPSLFSYPSLPPLPPPPSLPHRLMILVNCNQCAGIPMANNLSPATATVASPSGMSEKLPPQPCSRHYMVSWYQAMP